MRPVINVYVDPVLTGYMMMHHILDAAKNKIKYCANVLQPSPE